MIIQNEKEYVILRECGQRLGKILQELKRAVRSGVSTGFLDDCAARRIAEAGGDAVFKGYRTYGSRGAYPATVCVSVNEEIVHGIPKKERILQDGDIVGLDIGMRYPSKTGLITDTALTVAVGEISDDAKKLMKGTEEALKDGIKAAKIGWKIGDIGHAIETRLKKYKLSIIRDLVGHGVGKKLHEDPYIPNYGKPGTGLLLKEGMVIALEPMASLGSEEIVLDDDGWTYKTADNSLSAHFEHTIIITRDGAEIIT